MEWEVTLAGWLFTTYPHSNIYVSVLTIPKRLIHEGVNHTWFSSWAPSLRGTLLNFTQLILTTCCTISKIHKIMYSINLLCILTLTSSQYTTKPIGTQKTLRHIILSPLIVIPSILYYKHTFPVFICWCAVFAFELFSTLC